MGRNKTYRCDRLTSRDTPCRNKVARKGDWCGRCKGHTQTSDSETDTQMILRPDLVVISDSGGLGDTETAGWMTEEQRGRWSDRPTPAHPLVKALQQMGRHPNPATLHVEETPEGTTFSALRGDAALLEVADLSARGKRRRGGYLLGDEMRRAAPAKAAGGGTLRGVTPTSEGLCLQVNDQQVRLAGASPWEAKMVAATTMPRLPPVKLGEAGKVLPRMLSVASVIDDQSRRGPGAAQEAVLVASQPSTGPVLVGFPGRVCAVEFAAETMHLPSGFRSLVSKAGLIAARDIVVKQHRSKEEPVLLAPDGGQEGASTLTCGPVRVTTLRDAEEFRWDPALWCEPYTRPTLPLLDVRSVEGLVATINATTDIRRESHTDSLLLIKENGRMEFGLAQRTRELTDSQQRFRMPLFSDGVSASGLPDGQRIRLHVGALLEGLKFAASEQVTVGVAGGTAERHDSPLVLHAAGDTRGPGGGPGRYLLIAATRSR